MDLEKTYAAAIERAVLIPLADQGKICLVGPEAASFLHNLCTNDIKKMPVGGGCEAFLCNARARTLAHIFVGRYEGALFSQEQGDCLLLDMIPSLTEKVFQHLNKYLVSEQVEIFNKTAELGMVRLSGPGARTILEQVFARSLADLPAFHHVACQEATLGLTHVRPHHLLGMSGYDLFFPADKLEILEKFFVSKGMVLGGAELHEILRVEAGTPVYGLDMDDNRFVAEVGRTAQAISYNKGCYLGQEPVVMARDRGQVNRTLLGIRVKEGEPLASGSKLFQGNNEVGQVTSSIRSPRFGVIGLAYLRRGSQEPGTALMVDPTSDGRQAMVSSLPFVGLAT